ncbi:structural maintenance of chromosomes protein 4 [Parasteatoda tepidariorum]|uniref:structural maintenance of chromosomes protein 4 n=2 Tax=Parasteatoda tepidariorum TaxID=114398 RepID=UPI000A2C067E
MHQPTAEQLGFIEDADGAISIDEITISSAPAPALSTDVPNSRLIIDSLLVRNFKSYAGEQVIGPFNKNFTAVVGPNGSGKSNVIDSLLFVFGYRAKKIRSKKVSHLIHKSDQYPDLPSCTVTVHFAYVKDEGERGVIIKDSRFSLSRTAFKDDSSYYEMSNKRVPYKDVSKALKAYGIDLEHSRFLILQGEIEAISLMNPKAQNEHETGMLEYIEDIIGSNRFIEPIKHFKEKVEKLNEERKLLVSQLKMVEKEKDELEGPKNKAIEFLRLENKLCLTENSLYHLKRYQAQSAFEEVTEKKNKFLEEMKALKFELENVRASKKTVENSMNKINSEYESFQKKYEETKEEYANLERQDAANLMLIKHSKEKTQKLEKSLEDAKNELNKLNKQSGIYEQETVELQAKKKKLEEEKEVDGKKMEEAMGSLKQETNVLQEKKDKLEAELVQLKNVSGQIKSEMDLSQSELNILKSGEKKEKEKLDSIIASHERTVQSLMNEQKLMKVEKEKLSGPGLDDLQCQVEEAKAKEAALTQQLKMGRYKLEEARTALSTSSSRSTIVQAFLKEKAKGRFTGVYGRLGDLGAIDEKYDIAISTACGSLDNIVTDTIATARECVEHLRKHNLGYTTFIALDKMKEYEELAHRKIATPEDSVRLFDMIKVKDPEILNAFYFAIRDTLVARDLEQATRIGLQGSRRFRVVTLKGELIETSGTMSGGGGRPQKGRMGQTVVQCTVTTDDVNEIQREVDNLNQQLMLVRKQRLNLEELISQKTSVLSSLKHSLKKRTMNINAYEESVKELSSQMETQKRKVDGVKVDDKKVKMLENVIKEKNKRYTKAIEEETAVEQNVAKLQAEILQISKGKFQKVKKNVTQLEKKLTEVTQAITKSTVNLKAAKRNIKKIEEKIKNVEIQMQENKAQLDNLRKQQSTLTDKGKEVLQLMEENNVKVAEFKEKRAEFKKETDSITQKEHKLKQAEIEHKNQLKNFESSEMEKRHIIKSYNAKICKLKLNEVEDDPTVLPSLSEEKIQKLTESALSNEIDVIKVQLEDMKPDLSAIKEFKTKLGLYEAKQKEVDDITEDKNLQSRRFDYLSNRRNSEFKTGFSIIASKLKEIYRMLTHGGDAEIELVDSMNAFSKGIEFSVRPPKKSWKYMRNLSGGEKTLSSLSLVFALHYYRPTPFYVMDEIDAALDVRNVAIVGFYLKETTLNCQFIIVSLRNVMNELSDHLLGIFKINNCTRNLSIQYVRKWNENSANGRCS